MKKINRRKALQQISLGIASLYVTACASPYKKNPLSPMDEKNSSYDLSEVWKKISPIQRSRPEPAPPVYTGDQPAGPHAILWDKEKFLKEKNLSLPKNLEKARLVVIGGGLSGLTTAYLLRHHKPIILEQASALGGNAKGESWRGIDYSIGAAYFMQPEKDSGIDKILKEIGIDKIARVKGDEDPVVLNSKRVSNFWSGVTAPESKAQFEKIAKHFADVSNEKNGWTFPDYPTDDLKLLKKIQPLDRISFKKHLEKVAGGKLHPHIVTNLEHYCWSSYGAGFDEISAAAGLNFYAAEFGGEALMVTPGGNSAVTEALGKKLYEQDPSHIRTQSLVFDVKVKNNKTEIYYLNTQGEIKGIEADYAVMSCPKFVVKRILNGIEPARLAAINKLKYNAYLVANVCINKHIPEDFYDLFLLNDGTCDSSNLMKAAMDQKATDVIHACFAKPVADKSVLTLYRALPFAAGRPILYAENSYEQFRKEFEEQITNQVLPLFNLKNENVEELRISRWGHPLPVASPGLISEGHVKQLRKPFKDRIFFAEQDNWSLPALETAIGEALLMAEKIDAKLKA